jgi:hypothetical protein
VVHQRVVQAVALVVQAVVHLKVVQAAAVASVVQAAVHQRVVQAVQDHQKDILLNFYLKK